MGTYTVAHEGEYWVAETVLCYAVVVEYWQSVDGPPVEMGHARRAFERIKSFARQDSIVRSDARIAKELVYYGTHGACKIKETSNATIFEMGI